MTLGLKAQPNIPMRDICPVLFSDNYAVAHSTTVRIVCMESKTEILPTTRPKSFQVRFRWRGVVVARRDDSSFSLLDIPTCTSVVAAGLRLSYERWSESGAMYRYLR